MSYSTISDAEYAEVTDLEDATENQAVLTLQQTERVVENCIFYKVREDGVCIVSKEKVRTYCIVAALLVGIVAYYAFIMSFTAFYKFKDPTVQSTVSILLALLPFIFMFFAVILLALWYALRAMATSIRAYFSSETVVYE